MTLLVFAELLAGCIWVGGFTAIAIVAPIVRRQLAPQQRVYFFRVLGQRYLRVAGAALLVTLACGSVLLARGSWQVEKTVAAALGAALLVVTTVGVVQARSLGRLRSVDAAGEAHARSIARGTGSAACLRALIGLLTLAELAIAARLLHP